jgi:hypothetical protein
LGTRILISKSISAASAIVNLIMIWIDDGTLRPRSQVNFFEMDQHET